MGVLFDVECINDVDVFTEGESYQALVIEEWELMGVLDDLGEEWMYDQDVFDLHFRLVEDEEDQ